MWWIVLAVVAVIIIIIIIAAVVSSTRNDRGDYGDGGGTQVGGGERIPRFPIKKQLKNQKRTPPQVVAIIDNLATK